MASFINMPRLSPTMEEGTLAKWTKKEGDAISPGDIIAEVETDKANMDFPLEDEGVLLKLLVKAGDVVKLGAPVAVLGERGEDISALLKEQGGAGQGSEAKPAQAPDKGDDAEDAEAQTAASAKGDGAEAQPAETEAKPAEAKPTGAGPKVDGAQKPASAQQSAAGQKAGAAQKPETTHKPAAPATAAGESAATRPTQRELKTLPRESAPPPAAPPPEAPAESGRTLASPLARRLAGDEGVDIRQIHGSGPGGRIVKRDIERALEERANQPAAAPAPASAAAPAPAPATTAAPAAPAALGAGDEVQPLSMMRRTIARRLVEAKQSVPHFYLTTEAGVDALWRFREDLNAAAAAQGSTVKVSINDFILKATARALRQVPAANASFSAEGIVRHSRVDVGVAVSLEDGLLTPVVRNADQKAVGAIATEVRDLAERARHKKLRPDEYQNGTITVSNLGMYGIREFFAIINPPESAILAIGKVEKRPVVVEKDGQDQVVIERRLTLTLSCDHRVVDGALGARLLAEVVKGLEHPLLLVL